MTRTFCNPLDLPYRYQDKIAPGKQAEWRFREAADPTVIAWEGYYLLFASMSGGFWYSTDLITWEFKATPELPIEDYAPDVRLIDGTVVFCASKRGQLCTFFASTDPVHMPFEPVATTMEFWDPDLFQDDDGRIYLYWGCTSTEPVWGIELERGTFAPIGEKVAVVPECEAEHGWERKGENNHLEEPKTEMERMIRARTGTKPFIEGAYMTKHDGRYYLQYAAPGTENNVYADGVYVGESPLGPFTYQAWNPFSSNPGGFMQGAGHGSTFQDAHGNWWHASTMRISVNEKFERRVGLFPCYFDADGTMHCDQRLACYPQVVPEGARLRRGGRARVDAALKGRRRRGERVERRGGPRAGPRCGRGLPHLVGGRGRRRRPVGHARHGRGARGPCDPGEPRRPCDPGFRHAGGGVRRFGRLLQAHHHGRGPARTLPARGLGRRRGVGARARPA